MLTSSYAQCKGISGCGKGTRMSLLQLFFIYKGYKYQLYHTSRPNLTENLPIALEIPEINLFMIGKWVCGRSSKLWSWTSLDYLNTTFGSYFVYWLMRKFSYKNLTVDGYPLTLSPLYRADAINKKFGYDNIFYMYFKYDNIDQLRERCFNRNGGRVIKGTSWNTESGTISDRLKNIELGKSVPNFKLYDQRFDDPSTIFGEKYLEFLGLSNLIPEFIEFTKTNSNLRKMGDTQDLSLIKPIIENNYSESIYIPFNNDQCALFYDGIK